VDEWLYPVLRFAHYALLLGLFGGTAFRLIGLRQSTALNTKLHAGRKLRVLACAAPIVSVAVMLFSIATMMGQPFWQVELTTIEAMITGTSIGWAFLVRLALLLTASATLILNPRSTYANAIAALLFGLALVTFAWSGHAAASEGALGAAHKLSDAVHLLAAGLWLGAIGWFLCLTVDIHRRPGMIVPEDLLADMHRFAPLGVLLVAVVGFTGLTNAQLIFGLENSAAVLGTGYGMLLIVKIGLVGSMLIFGARNALAGQRHSKAGPLRTAGAGNILAQLRVALAGELALAMLVIGLTAWIGTMSPMVE